MSMYRTITKDMSEFERGIYQRYIAHKNQALWRGIDYQLSFEDYWRLWATNMDKIGKSANTYQMIRKDKDLGWTVDNAMVGTKELAVKVNGAHRRGVKFDWENYENGTDN